MDTNMYVGIFALVLLLFTFRRYVVLGHVCNAREAGQVIAIKRAIGRLTLLIMIILAGLFYLRGDVSIATELSVIAAIIVMVSTIVDWMSSVVPKGTVLNPSRDG
ncbi:MAG: hypothetical protein KJ928_00610 [Candidatus Altiarchaeota archaeon]|nr:hypothetical protein [Candidatus Altiarchaeota archaeon]MBU4437122.1 hypothetical protein [Candidatus Altiarchaeota archaeon]